MQLYRNYLAAALLFILCLSTLPGQAQTGFSFDIKKPEQYDDRILGSEKSESKKFTVPRRFTQNLFTHYNYFFNANKKLNEVLDDAKSRHKDDYTELLSFYNYSLDVTAENYIELDSIIYKATTGIVLHDLRNDWIDNLYLLTGAAYYLRKQFDSAYLTFQFINYAFAKKEKDGYYQTIGSKFDGNNAFSISTKEKNSIPKKIFSEPPSRNDAFIWLIRTLIAQEEYAEAASLIVTLKNDPAFPKRLKNDLEEVQAWWFYNNNVYDSAAVHLEKALGNAASKNERSRWEFLIAQLYELNGKIELAKEFYHKVINHTVDPVMEIYARLRSIRIDKSGGENSIDRNIAELEKMAKRDKYIDYRDIIYYTVAQMELERNDLKKAEASLLKSTKNNTNNLELKNKAFIQLAELAYAQRNYKSSLSYYDSLNLRDESIKNAKEITDRKKVLGIVVEQMEIIERQDSLQRIAAMNEDERREFVKKLARQIRKQQGLKEEGTASALLPIGQQQGQQQADLFSDNSAKGEWYFYNTSLKSKGLSEFKARWGNRPNVDNWRRAAGMSFQQANRPLTSNPSETTSKVPAKTATSGEVTFESLYENLPLTEELIQVSNDSISQAMYILGKALANDLEDCAGSVKVNDELVTRFPAFDKMDEVLFTLYYCYNKAGDVKNANDVKNVLEKKYPENRYTTIVTTGKDPGSNLNPDATRAYEKIYDLFIEGNFSKAIADKTIADSLYGSNYWTPQLMYIESVYYIRQKNDEKATQVLNNIIATQDPSSPMALKAATMIDVLSRRKQIEEELTKLDVTRVKVEKVIVPADTPVVKKDTTVKTVTPPPVIEKPKETDVKPVVEKPMVKPATDTIVAKPLITSYSYKAEDNYFAVVVLNRVDLVWVNETKNAFSIYNRNKFYNKTYTYSVAEISPETKLLLISSFDNAQSAADYITAVKPLSTSQIVPWLSAEKYSFTIISADNLEILKNQKDVNLYKQFIEKNFPGKF